MSPKELVDQKLGWFLFGLKVPAKFYLALHGMNIMGILGISVETLSGNIEKAGEVETSIPRTISTLVLLSLIQA